MNYKNDIIYHTKKNRKWKKTKIAQTRPFYNYGQLLNVYGMYIYNMNYIHIIGMHIIYIQKLPINDY